MNDCIFCHNPNKKLIENESAYSVLNISPASLGHFLIVPHKHITEVPLMRGKALVDLFSLVDETLDFMQDKMKKKDLFLVNFYSYLIENPPSLYDKEYSQNNIKYLEIMLDEAKLFNKPVGYNLGMNKKEGAGQRENHVHIHIFPRYKKGLGIVNAMRTALY